MNRVAIALIALAPIAMRGTATAGIDCTDPNAPKPDIPFLGTLRWDAAIAGATLDRAWDLGLGAMLGVAKLFEPGWYAVNFDVGVRASVAARPDVANGIGEAFARVYMFQNGQSFGIDECGCGKKTRTCFQNHDAAIYGLAVAGYGHHRDTVRGARDAALVGLGIGFEKNLTESSECIDPARDTPARPYGYRRSLFIEAGWRWDVVGSGAGEDARMGGIFVESGIRL